ncbi:type III secretion system needle length determinant [Pseudomonas fontis]|uniref:Type III secretion system needle length determinant n=1 Tax=Pseudomonas fontis TaxID=2942633 RepID=A0ABT5P085_9PSED|nr:type III secretion system needle length determinant [Pseudomonas fontis]MDD0976391.1 type III secretion system needle length determinant [Pseudomonas fontis]MDD0993723.1 type III secretion system needle length determinant [Pseudomonas fontis]
MRQSTLPASELLPVIGQPQTPGDRLLATLHSPPVPTPLKRELEQLISTLQAHLYSAAPAAKGGTLIRVTLPSLGTIEVHLSQVQGQLHVDISASAGSLNTLQQARGELLERLHRLAPEQPVSLAFGNAKDQGSRQRRNLYEEWEPEA